MQSLITVKSALDQWGGQYTVAAKRERVNAQGQLDPTGQEFVTQGYVSHYQHIPDVLKDAEREPAPERGEVEWPHNGTPSEPEPEPTPEPEEAPEQPVEDEPAPEEASVA